MIAVARPAAGPARVLASLGRVVRALLRLVLDVLACLGVILQPAFWSLVALAVAGALGRGFVGMGSPAFGGFLIGSLAMCIVLALLAWAERRHGWWSR